MFWGKKWSKIEKVTSKLEDEVVSSLKDEEMEDDIDMNDDIDYKNNFIEHLRKFEILFRNKKPRKSKKKKINKDEDFYY